MGLRGQVRYKARPRGFVRISVNLYSTHAHSRIRDYQLHLSCFVLTVHTTIWHHIVHYRNARLACDCVALN